jgi:hypothetical protein
MLRFRALVRVAAVLTTLWLTAGAEWPDLVSDVLSRLPRC